MKGLLITVVLGVVAYVGFKNTKTKQTKCQILNIITLSQDISV